MPFSHKQNAQNGTFKTRRNFVDFLFWNKKRMERRNITLGHGIELKSNKKYTIPSPDRMAPEAPPPGKRPPPGRPETPPPVGRPPETPPLPLGSPPAWRPPTPVKMSAMSSNALTGQGTTLDGHLPEKQIFDRSGISIYL